MKFSQMGRAAMASVLSMAIALGFTACSRDYTVAYVYATSTKSNPGVVNSYSVDYQSGSLIQLEGSGVQVGRNPVTLVTAPNGLFLYVVNHDDSSVSELAIGTDGKIYPMNTYNVTGSFPTAAAVDSAGKFLYVTFTYQAGYGPALTGPGGITVFPINSDNSLGAPIQTVKVGNNPIALTLNSFNKFIYVLDQEASPNAAILGFMENTTAGTLTPAPGTTISTTSPTVATGYPAGVTPSAITEDPTGRFIYVTDQTSNQLIGYSLQSTGILSPMLNGPFATGLFPVGVTVDPRGKYLYVANYTSNTVGAYAINTATGTPSTVVPAPGAQLASGAVAVGTGPTCLTIEPALGIYLFTSNQLDGTLSGEQLDPHTGDLSRIQNTPFPTAGEPSCVVSVPNGSHTTQIVTP